MKRICPRCQIEMNDNCYVKDLGKSSLSYLQLIIKKENFVKEKNEIQSCYCPQCGYVELYIDINKQTEENVNFDDNKNLFQVVEKYANWHHQRLQEEQERLTRLQEEQKQKRLENERKSLALKKEKAIKRKKSTRKQQTLKKTLRK